MAADDPWIGATLDGRYRVTELIGRGGMAAVYRASDIQLNRTVALKIFAPGAASDDVRRRAEVQLLARLNNPNLVTLFDARLAPEGSTQPSYLSMELVDGPDLRLMMDRVRLSAAVTAQLAIDIAEALVTVHASGVVHRDLKPANVLLAPTGLPSPKYRAKLADFGIAHLIGGERLTTTGLIIGTAAYLSPEQASGLEPGAPADIYALGLVILECLTGERAFAGTMAETISARLTRGPDIPPTLPAAWASLIGEMTRSDPAARPTAVDVAVTARRIAPELDGWMPFSSAEIPADGTDATVPATDATVPAPEPTAVMPEPTRVLPGGASVGSEPTAVLPDSARATSAPTELLESEHATAPGGSGGTVLTLRRAAIAAGILVVLAAVLTFALLSQPGRDAPHSVSTPGSSSGQSSSPSSSFSPSSSVTPHTVVSSPLAPAPKPSPPGHGHGKDKPKKDHKGK